MPMRVSNEEPSHLFSPLLCLYIPWHIARMLVPGGWRSLRAAWKEALFFKWRFFAFTLLVPLITLDGLLTIGLANSVPPSLVSRLLLTVFQTPVLTVIATTWITRNSVRHSLLRQAARAGMPVCTRCAYEVYPAAANCCECGEPCGAEESTRVAPSALAFPSLVHLPADDARSALLSALRTSWITRHRFLTVAGLWLAIVIALFFVAISLDNRVIITALVLSTTGYPLFAEWRIRRVINRRLDAMLTATEEHAPLTP
ncbi:MAG: hypothetical protein AB7G17_06545 [Phycisphaerales bacterium]